MGQIILGVMILQVYYNNLLYTSLLSDYFSNLFDMQFAPILDGQIVFTYEVFDFLWLLK